MDIFGGNGAFFAGDKVDEEEGVYFSEIFNGTNDLIKWDSLTWVATEPTNTDVLLYVRTFDSQTDILLEDFSGPYTIGFSSGVDLSFLSGQFIQFKAVLKSRTRNISPTLSRVIIRSVTSEAVHFFTTNFALTDKIKSGILTSRTVLPVSSDVVFGINTENSIDFAEYQIIDENKLFNVIKTDTNLRVGIKFISPSASTLVPETFDEYGPYNTNLYINTVNFVYQNGGADDTFNFKITFYSDINLTEEKFSADTSDAVTYFSADSEDFPAGGLAISSGDESTILYAVPSSANLVCNTYYFVKIEVCDSAVVCSVAQNDWSFIKGCSPSYVDDIAFIFTNTTGSSHNYDFRIRFYSDPERTNLLLTKFSGNNQSEWSADGNSYPSGGYPINNGFSAAINFNPDLSGDDFSAQTFYYLTIDSFDGSSFDTVSSDFTFIIQDFNELIYCGEYSGVPIVRNFGMMFEMDNNATIKLASG